MTFGQHLQIRVTGTWEGKAFQGTNIFIIT